MNSGVIRVRFEEHPELKHSQAGKPYCTTKAMLVVHGRQGEQNKEAQVYLKAFGVMGDRLAAARVGPSYLVSIEYDVSEGYGEKNKGKFFADMIVRGIGEEIAFLPPTQHRAGDVGTSGMKRGAPPQREVQDDLDLPF